MIRRADHVLQNPTALVGLLVAGQIVAWTLAPTLTHVVPPLDVVEGYMWGREWVIATYKHPALPSWVLEATRILTGRRRLARLSRVAAVRRRDVRVRLSCSAAT